MIWIVFTFIAAIAIAIAFVANNEWRIALRIIAPIAVVIASLVGLITHQANDEKQHREAQGALQDERLERAKRSPGNPPAKIPNIKEEGREKLRLADERKSTAEAFLANNSSLIELYFNSASRCHSALTFTGKMEDDTQCRNAMKAKDELQQLLESLTGISKKDLKRANSTTMWRIEYADKQMDSAYQISKRRK